MKTKQEVIDELEEYAAINFHNEDECPRALAALNMLNGVYQTN
jgi:hypothetical protein